MYKAVFLDVGGIILRIDWNRPFEFAGINDPRRRHELIEKIQGWKHFHLYEKGRISTDEFLAGFDEIMGMKRPKEFWLEAWESILIAELPDVHLIFDKLKGKIPIHAVSNTNPAHYEYQMKHFPVGKRFDKYFTSFGLHERKPDAEFFLKVCEGAGIEPNEGLFVDDTMENVEAARRVGFTSAQTVNSPRETLQFLAGHLRLKI